MDEDAPVNGVVENLHVPGRIAVDANSSLIQQFADRGRRFGVVGHVRGIHWAGAVVVLHSSTPPASLQSESNDIWEIDRSQAHENNLIFIILRV
jgi:hypothetical protein